MESTKILVEARPEREPAEPVAWQRAGRGLLAVRVGGVWRDALLRRLLATADLVAVAAGAGTLALAKGESGIALVCLALAPLWVVLAKLHGLYDRDQRALRHLTLDELPRIAAWAAIGAAFSAVSFGVVGVGRLTQSSALWMAFTIGFVALIGRGSMRAFWRRLTPPERTLIVGEGFVADAVRRKIELFPDMHIALVESSPDLTARDLETDPARLAAFDRVIVASQSIDDALIDELVAGCRAHHVKLSVVPPSRRMFGTAVQLHHVAELPIVEYNTWDTPRSTVLLKDAIDFGAAALLLILSLPLLAFAALAVKIDSRGPALFVQTRAGRFGQPFPMFKFRTMVRNAEALLPELVRFDELEQPMFKLTHDPRLTRVGRFLRRTSIDELPQLFNVLRGDMSLVGPRPEQLDLVERYAPEDRFRLKVKPGLTGPMQVFGRGALNFEERLAVEREYIENLSIGRDLHILGMTIAAVVGGRGAL